MSPVNKILIGAAGSALIALLAGWQFGLCDRCAAARGTGADGGTAAIVAEAPATPEAVANCQTSVDAATKGKTILFASGGAGIAPESLAEITTIANSVKDCAGTIMEVAGHTDLTGGDAANLALSKSRADSVVKSMVDLGVPAQRLVAKGYGETQPVVPGTSREANTKNRRTEFHLQPAGAAPDAAAAK